MNVLERLTFTGMQTLLESILADPGTGGRLQWDAGAKHWINPLSFAAYSVREGVIDLRPKIPLVKPQLPELHRRYGTSFEYLEHYQRDAEVFDYTEPPADAATRHENRRLHQRILEALPQKAELVLDVGCGNAWLAEALLPKGKTVLSMDISTANPQKALQRFPSERHIGLVADAYHLPILPGSLDAIVTSEIMEHVPDPKLFIEKLTAALKPGGVLVITTPYDEQRQYHLCVHCNRPTPSHAHLHSFSEANIGEFIPESIGYETRAFHNTYLLRLKSHLIFRWLPHWTWKVKDAAWNNLFGKPTRFLIRLTRPKAKSL